MMKIVPFLLSALSLWLCMPQVARGEQTDSLKLIHRLGMDFRPSYIVQDESFFRGENCLGKPIRFGYSGHLKYSFQFAGNSRWGLLYPYTYQGIGVSYNDLGNHKEIGSPVAVYAFQGSRIATLASVLSLDYEWNFGAFFGWKKYNNMDNSNNYVVGSKINAYINLGFLLNWQMTPQWNLTAGVDLTHYSNGNTGYPNLGVNLVGGRVGVVYVLGSGEPKRGASAFAYNSDFKPYVSYDVVVYGAGRKRAFITEDESFMIPGTFGIVGFNFTPMYNFNRFFRAGLSLDAQYDESANVAAHYVGGGKENPKFYRPPFREQFGIGLSARGELVMPIFAVNLGIGYNVWQKGEDTKGWYQVLALKTSITRNLFLHVGYQLSKFKAPNNLMLGLGWRFE